MAKGRVIQTVWELKDRFTPGVERAKKSTLQYKREVRDLKRAGSAAFDTLRKGAIALAATTAGLATAGFAAAKKFGGVADEIDKASMRAGVGTEYLQEMRYAMDQVGVSSDVLDRLLKRTNQRLGMAEAGNKKYDKALKEMGISTRNTAGEIRSAEEVFDDAVDSLSRMENAQDRARLAGEFFGVMAAQNLLPALEAGGDAIKDLRQEAHRLGVVIEDDLVAAGTKFNDGMIDVKRSAQGLFYTLATPALPLFTRGINWLSEGMIKLRGVASSALDSFRNAIDSNRDRINVLLNGIVGIKNSIVGAFGSSGEGGGAVSWFVNDAIPAVVGGITSILEGAMNTYHFVRDHWSLISPIVFGIVGALTAYHGITNSIIFVKRAWTAAQWALNVALNANPIGKVTLLIGGLIAAGTFLIKNWEDIKLLGMNVWNSVVSGAEWMANKVVDAFNWMLEKSMKPLNAVIEGLNKIPGVDIDPVSFSGFDRVDLGSRQFNVEGREYQWGRRVSGSDEEDFEDILSRFDKDQEFKIEQQQASNDNLIQALDTNTETMKGTAGRVNDIHVTLYASDMTAEQIADELVPKIKRKLFAT